MNEATANQTPINITSIMGEILNELRKQRVSDDLWTTDDIAAYLKRAKRTISNHVVNAPNFPRPVRLPLGKNQTSDPLWVAKEVKAWALRFKETTK